MTDPDKSPQLADVREMVELQAKVCYMNVDRTLATWTRTALTLVVFGFVVDHFGLLVMHDHLSHSGTRLAPNPLSSLGGVILVALGMFIAVTAAARHQAYRANWRRVYGGMESFGPWLAFTFAVMVAVFGSAILAVLLLFAQ